MIWTLVLVSLGITGTWFSARHWWGWLISAGSEIVWLAYAATIGSLPLAIMSVVWFCVHARNVVTTYWDQTPLGSHPRVDPGCTPGRPGMVRDGLPQSPPDTAIPVSRGVLEPRGRGSRSGDASLCRSCGGLGLRNYGGTPYGLEECILCDGTGVDPVGST